MSCTWLNPIALPFALLLMALYTLFQNGPDDESRYAYALALIFVAVIVRVLLLPFQMKSKRGMMKQTRLQPKVAELQKRHGANKQKLNEEMAKLYKDEGVNPASGCLWSFIQMPIMIALFYAIRQPFTLMMRIGDELWETMGEAFNESSLLYQKLLELANQGVLQIPERLLDAETGFYNAADFYAELYIAQDVSIHWEHFRNLGIEGLQRISFYLGNVNLAEVPQWNFFWNTDWSNASIWGPALLLFLLPVVSGAAQFLSAHIMRKLTPQQPTPEGGAGTVMKLMPLMSVWFGFILPAALSVYWTIGTGLQIAQDIWLTKKYTKILDEEDAERDKLRKEKEAEIEAKRLETERLKAEGLITENRNTSKRKKQKSERQGQRERAARWEKEKSPDDAKESDDEPSRIGNRRYARGRAYDPGRYNGNGSPADDSDGSISSDSDDEPKSETYEDDSTDNNEDIADDEDNEENEDIADDEDIDTDGNTEDNTEDETEDDI